jgi:hypothetical protein
MVQVFREKLMKNPWPLLALPLFSLTNSALADDAIPATAKFARYEAMVKRSPFAVASAGAPTGATPDFARDLYVANAAHFASGDFVTVASTTNKDLKEYLNSKETVNGYTISNIQWSDRVGETKVTIAKDGQFATLTFNEALLSQAIANPVAPIPPTPQGIPGHPATNIGRPNPNNIPAPVQRAMPVPQIPTPPPHVRPVIRRKAQPQPQPQQVNPQASADDNDLDTP